MVESVRWARLRSFAWALPVLLGLGALAVAVAVLAPPAPPPPLRVVIGPWIGYEPLVLARENEWLAPGLRVVESLSNTESNQLLRDGSADLAGVTLDEAIRLRSEGVPVQIVAVLSDSRGADAVVARPGIAGLADLRGRRVLVEDTAVGYYLLERALAEAGLVRGDVRQVQVQSTFLPSRWRAGDADAAVTYDPMLSELVGEGATVLFSTRDHPGLVLDVLVAREAVLRDRRADVQHLLDGWDRAVAAFAHPDQLPLAVLTADGRLAPEAYLGAVAGVDLFDARERRAFMAGRPSALDRAIDAMARSLQEGSLGPDLRLDGRLVAPPLDAAEAAPRGQEPRP